MSVKGPGFDPRYCLFQDLYSKLVNCHHLTNPSYNQLGLEHLLDKSTYKMLTEHQAHQDAISLEHQIYDWTIRNHQALSDDKTNFIQKHLEANKEPHGYFYLLIKLQKEKILGHPVCSDCGSLPHSLGRWVDEQLQPIVKD